MRVGMVPFRGGENILPDSTFSLIYDYSDVKRCDLVILHGGEDISPSIYNQKAVHTDASNTPSKRDKNELAIIDEATKTGVPIFGICRGAQLLCAVAGGSLFQHVNGHNRDDHQIITSEGQILTTNSCHHQAMRLNNKGIILAQNPFKLADFRWLDDTTSAVKIGRAS